MIKLIEKYKKRDAERIEEWLIDTDADLADLGPAPAGSYAISAESSKKFYVNNDGTWPDPSKYQGGGGDDELKTSFIGMVERDVTELTVPNGTTKIGERAFHGCFKLTSLSLPNSLTMIDNNAFYDCQYLALTSLPEGVTNIGQYAFSGCRQLALTSLPDNIQVLSAYAFNDCRQLALTSLPNSLTMIDTNAFTNCQQLALTSIPAGVTIIAYRAFYNCYGLTTLTFEGTPTSLDGKAFQNCTNLLTINVPWSEGAVSGAPWGATNATINYNYRTPGLYDADGVLVSSWDDLVADGSITMSDDGTSVTKCDTNLSGELTIPDGVTSIGTKAFSNCDNLALTELPDGVTKIENYAFDKCTKLALTELPARLRTIGDYALWDCRGLTELTFKGTPTIIFSTAFNGCTNLTTINVPWAEGAVADAPWGATNATINYNYTGE